MGYYRNSMRLKVGKKQIALAILAVLSTFAVWLPFVLKLETFWGLDFSPGMMAVWGNFDGPNYLIIARTWYEKSLIASTFSSPLPLEYYPAHWPFYPAIISLFDLITSGPKAMLLASVCGSVVFYWVLYRFLLRFGVSERNAFLLGCISLVIPARWLAIRSVGSPEAWFGAFIMLSLLAYKDKKYFQAGVWGALAQFTKSPAILLFAGYGLFELYKLIKGRLKLFGFVKHQLALGLIPLTILVVFAIYYYRTGDFLAYFHSGDNFHLLWPPFSIFGKGGVWVGDFWLEDVIWLWLVYGIGIARLFRRKYLMPAFFGSVFFATTLFVSHRDISRYIVPILPLALLGWEKIIAKKETKWVVALLILPALLFSWNFLLNNSSPIADWAPYL